MSGSTKFLLLVIIGIAIVAIGTHLAEIFVGLLAIIALMFGFYGLPLLAVLFLLVIAWRLVFGAKSKPKEQVTQVKKANLIEKNTNPHIEIQRELNRMKHQIGQHNKKQK